MTVVSVFLWMKHKILTETWKESLPGVSPASHDPSCPCFFHCLACIEYQDEAYTFTFFVLLTIQSHEQVFWVQNLNYRFSFLYEDLRPSMKECLLTSIDELGNGIYPSWVNWSLLYVKSPFNTCKMKYILNTQGGFCRGYRGETHEADTQLHSEELGVFCLQQSLKLQVK